MALQGRAAEFAERDLGAVFLGAGSNRVKRAAGSGQAEVAGGVKAHEGATESDGSR